MQLFINEKNNVVTEAIDGLIQRRENCQGSMGILISKWLFEAIGIEARLP